VRRDRLRFRFAEPSAIAPLEMQHDRDSSPYFVASLAHSRLPRAADESRERTLGGSTFLKKCHRGAYVPYARGIIALPLPLPARSRFLVADESVRGRYHGREHTKHVDNSDSSQNQHALRDIATQLPRVRRTSKLKFISPLSLSLSLSLSVSRLAFGHNISGDTHRARRRSSNPISVRKAIARARKGRRFPLRSSRRRSPTLTFHACFLMIHIHSPSPSPPRSRVQSLSGTRYSLLQKNRERESEFREINEGEFYVTRVPDTMQAGTSSSFEIAAECLSIVVIDKRVSRLISECPMLSRARAVFAGEDPSPKLRSH